MADELTVGFSTDLKPTCDRCGAAFTGGAVDQKTMQAVCFACLTDDEAARLGAGRPPLEET